jgi:CheY-like chemotaxis protein/anti-sigma regulatory factor (Ser/Thr protein kinase)
LEQDFRPRIESKGLAFRLDVSSSVPRYVRADETKLRQILINLLANALKYAVRGYIQIKVDLAANGRTKTCPVDDSHSKKSSEPYKLCICVEDSGPGIAAEELDNVFQAFVQTTNGQQRQEGTGLGLALSKQFAHLLGGELTVESTVGKGSVFVFTFPCRAAAADQVQPRQQCSQVMGLEHNQGRYRILVADDLQSSRRLVVDILSSISCADLSETGFNIRQAANGVETIDIWQQWHPHLIWMDMRMPVMDGYEATRRIKASDQSRRTVIIGLSACAFEEDRTAVLEAGCDDFLRKPFRISDFFDMMHKHIGVRYIYQDRHPGNEPPLQAPVQMELIADSLSKLPESILSDLRKATEETNPIKTQAIVEQIAEQNHALAAELYKLTADFKFDVLRDMLKADA